MSLSDTVPSGRQPRTRSSLSTSITPCSEAHPARNNTNRHVEMIHRRLVIGSPPSSFSASRHGRSDPAHAPPPPARALSIPLYDPLHRPRPRGQRDRPAARRAQPALQMPPDPLAHLVGDRGEIRGGCAGSPEEGRPVVLEALEDGGNLDGAERHLLQTHPLEQRL